MEAVEKVLPSNPGFPVVVLAKDQPEYKPLPVARVIYEDGTIASVTHYRLTWKERLKILFCGSLWIEQLTFGKLFQPQRPTVDEPFKGITLDLKG